MRLIATVGAGSFNISHKYIINNKEYLAALSFLALAKAYKIKDIVVIGTKKTESSIKSILKDNPNIKMETIESDDVEELFQKSLEHIGRDTILDLTQGYRHYPMLTLLASIFLQNSKDKNVKDIFYAQIEDENCQPRENSCPYKFVSLIKYLDIANMARIINTFNKTLLTLDYEVYDKEFLKLKKYLENLTNELFSNDFKDSSKESKEIEKLINTLLSSGKLDTIKEHLNSLKKEIKTIQKLKANNESETLLNVSEYFLSKNILLHSVTLLYESMVAYLDENINLNKCNKVEKRGRIVDANTYQRRNCLKLKMDCSNQNYKTKIAKCQDFSKLLRKIDSLRNTSAHAHTTGTYQENLKKELNEAINFLKPIIKKDISIKDKLNALQNMFK